MRNIQILGTLICCLYSLMFIPNQVYSQVETSNRALEVVVDESSNAYFTVNFEKGQTLYSICKEFHIATIDAMMLNEIVNPDQISIGETLKLPLNREFFKVKKPFGQGFIPVYYKVKKQETLFRISKVYFAQDVKDMIERNKMSGFTLSIDEKLLVGYYQIESGSTVTEIEQYSETPIQEPAITRPAITEPATVTEAVKTNEYVLVDSHVVKEENIERSTGIHPPVQNTIIEKVEPTTSVPQETIVTIPDTEVAVRSQITTVPTQHDVAVQQAQIERKANINSVPPVGSYRFKPSTRVKTKKKEIGNDRLDHSVANNKYEQIRLAGETGVDTTLAVLEEEKPVSNLVSTSKKGIAYWDKKGKDYENLMVLHKSAEVNTLIKLTNPVNGLSTFARVVGKIPENAFKKDIDVVLSPAVARKIGAIDSRMQIAMTYQIIKP